MEVPEDVTLLTPTYQQLHSILKEEVTTGSFVGTYVRPFEPVPDQELQSILMDQEIQAAPVGRDAAMTSSSPQMSESCPGRAQLQAVMARAQDDEAAAVRQAAAATYGYEQAAGNQRPNTGYEEGTQGQQAAQVAGPAPAPEGGEERAPPQFSIDVIGQGGSGQVPPGAIPRVADRPRRQQHRPSIPTPGELGVHQLHCVSLSDLTTQDVGRIAAEAAERVLEGKMHNLELGMGPPRDASHPLIAFRKPLEFRIFLANVHPEEILKAGASVAALCRLQASKVQFLRIRHPGAICERLPRAVIAVNMIKNVMPEEVTAEYKLTAGVEWRLLSDLPQFRHCRTFNEFHAVTCAVEHMLKCKFQIQYLKSYGGGQQGIRLDYRRFRNEHPAVVYIGFPHRGDPDANLICGWNPYCGLDYGTERLESDYPTLPEIFKD